MERRYQYCCHRGAHQSPVLASLDCHLICCLQRQSVSSMPWPWPRVLQNMCDNAFKGASRQPAGHQRAAGCIPCYQKIKLFLSKHMNRLRDKLTTLEIPNTHMKYEHTSINLSAGVWCDNLYSCWLIVRTHITRHWEKGTIVHLRILFWKLNLKIECQGLTMRPSMIRLNRASSKCSSVLAQHQSLLKITSNRRSQKRFDKFKY